MTYRYLLPHAASTFLNKEFAIVFRSSPQAPCSRSSRDIPEALHASDLWHACSEVWPTACGLTWPPCLNGKGRWKRVGTVCAVCFSAFFSCSCCFQYNSYHQSGYYAFTSQRYCGCLLDINAQCLLTSPLSSSCHFYCSSSCVIIIKSPSWNEYILHAQTSKSRLCQNDHHVSADVCRVSLICQHIGNNYEKAAYLTELAMATDSHKPQSKLQHTREKTT